MSLHPTARIHPTALVETGARIGAGCIIGPFTSIGPEVTLHDHVEIKSHVVVTGWTELGEGCIVYPFACVGEVPQDLKYRGERTRLTVGARTMIREGATLSLGTASGSGHTKVGEECLLMTGSHVGHDTWVGDRVIMANQSALAGHCIIEDEVIIGGLSGVHQYVRVGRGAIIGAITMVTHDVIPFGLVQGPRGKLDGLNLVGLKRRGLDRGEIGLLREAYDMLAKGEGALQERAARIAEASGHPMVREMAEFILGDTDRQFLKPQ